MALPDVDRNSWQRDQADLFRQLTNAKIGAAQFAQTTGQQIADASARLAALPTPSSLEGPSSRASQASQPLDTTSGIAPSALTMPVQASFGDSSTQASDTASGSRGGSFGDFASGLIDQARQRVAALGQATPGGPADVSTENAPPSWLPGRQAAGVVESPEDALRSRVATVPNVPETAGQVGQTALAYANQQSAQNAAAFPDKPLSQYTPAEQEGAIQGAGKAALGVLGGDLPGAGDVGKVAGEAAAPIAGKISDVAQGAVDRFYHGTGTSEIGAYPLAGDVVSGMKVHAETPNLSSIGATLGDDAYTVLRGVREVPMRYFEQPPALTPRNKELARQIVESGTIKPLIVGIDQEGPYILEGAHRYDALKINGAQSFPAVVVAESGARPVPPAAGPPATPPSGGTLGGGGGAVQRFFHGTGSAFDRPDALKFDPNGLFGPGYYLTSSPEVASSYATEGPSVTHLQVQHHQMQQLLDETRQKLQRPNLRPDLRANLEDTLAFAQRRLGELTGAAPNVRAVNVPSGLRLLDADTEMTPEAIHAITDQLPPTMRQTFINRVLPVENTNPLMKRMQEGQAPSTGEDVYRALADLVDHGNGEANKVIGAAGFDGISYLGGRRTPLMDAQGQPIQHQAVVIFPESLPKITNAISGTTMGSPPAIGGAVLGGAIGASQGDTPEERARNAAIGAATGGGLGLAAERLGPRVAPLIHTPAWLNEILAPARNAPQDVQNALRTFANARLAGQVDAETLGMRAQRILGSADTSQAASNFERTGQFTPKPTPEQQSFGGEIQQFMRDTGQQGRANGYIAGDVTTGAPGAPAHYFPHIYQDNLNAARIAAGKGGLNPRDFYSNSRVFPTLQDAIAAGKQPLDSVSEPLRHYAARIGDSEAKVALVSDLRNASPSAVMDLTPGQQAPPGWTPGGAVAPQFYGVAFPSATADAIKNILNPSAFRNFAAVRGAQSALAEAKGTLFSLSGFHLLTELRQAYRANGIQGVPVIGRTLWNAMVPGAYGNFRLANADLFSAAARAGVTGLAGEGRAIPDVEPGLAGRIARPLVRAVTGGVGAGASSYTTSKAAGEDEQTARDKALLFGAAGAIAGPTLGPVINQALWQRAVPTLKALTFGIARQSGRDPQAAATFVNQTFGGNNLAAIARSPTFQDALRLATMAPDWWEGWARQLGGIVNTKALGGMSRAYWLRTALVDGAFGLEGLNYALNGHFTDQNDPEHRFDLELTGLYDRQGLPHADPKTGMPARVYADILGPIRSMLNTTQGTAGVGGFVRGRLSVPMGVGVSALSNQDYRGRPIVPPFAPLPEAALKEGINAVGSVAPIGAQSLDQAGKVQAPPVLAGAAAVLGTRLSQGGQSTETAPGLSAASRAILDRNGLTYNPSQVGASIDNVPLTRAERTLYQERANQYRDQAITRLASEPGFARGTALQRQRALTADLRAADSKAADDVAKQIGGTEAKRRLSLAPAGKP